MFLSSRHLQVRLRALHLAVWLSLSELRWSPSGIGERSAVWDAAVPRPHHMQTGIERRRIPRLPLRLRASVLRRGGSEQFEAETENMSCDGVCFRSDESFGLGELLEITLDLEGILGPSHRDGGLWCLGRVVQAESDDPAVPFRYGCEILDYALRPAQATARGRPGTEAQVVAVR